MLLGLEDSSLGSSNGEAPAYNKNRTEAEYSESLALSPNGESVTCVLQGGIVQTFDSISGSLLRSTDYFPKYTRYFPKEVIFSSDGSLFAATSNDNPAIIWDTATHDLKQTLHGHSNLLLKMEFSHDGKFLVSYSSGGVMKIWDIATGLLHLQQIVDCQKESDFNLTISPNKRQIISAGQGLKVWDVASGTIERTLEDNRDEYHVIALSPDGSTLATASPNRSVRLWDMATGAVTQTALPES